MKEARGVPLYTTTPKRESGRGRTLLGAKTTCWHLFFPHGPGPSWIGGKVNAISS